MPYRPSTFWATQIRSVKTQIRGVSTQKSIIWNQIFLRYRLATVIYNFPVKSTVHNQIWSKFACEPWEPYFFGSGHLLFGSALIFGAFFEDFFYFVSNLFFLYFTKSAKNFGPESRETVDPGSPKNGPPLLQ